jgi:hypothetical protein
MACIVNSRYKQCDRHNDMLHHINYNMIVQNFEMFFILHISYHQYCTMICNLWMEILKPPNKLQGLDNIIINAKSEIHSYNIMINNYK